MSDEFKMWVQQEGEHNKWWTYEVSGNSVITRFGRIGHSGQSSAKSFSSAWDANDYAQNKLYEKTIKGYRSVTKEEYDLLRIQAEIMGSGNKVEQTMVLLEHKGCLYKLPPEATYDSSLKLAIGVIFRLRNKDGATKPYFLLFQDDVIYEVQLSRNQRSLCTTRKAEEAILETSQELGLKSNPVDVWAIMKKERVSEGHPLYNTIEKLEVMLGNTL